MVAHYKHLNTLATKAAVVVAAILVLSKFGAWVTTNSLSIQASLLDSVLDVGASLMNFFAVRHAFKPADEDHKYGHGKAEALAGLGQSAFIIGSAVWLVIESVQRFFHPDVLENKLLGSGVMLFAMILTFGLVSFQQYVVKKTHSLAVKADSLHYQTDFLTNGAVIISLMLSQYFNTPMIDSIIGGGIAIYILLTSWSIIKSSLNILMDRELDDITVDKIKNLIVSHPKVQNVHDLRTRSAGHKYFVQCHLDLDPNLSFIDAHAISQEVIALLKKEFVAIDICIHQDPIGHDENDFHE